MRFEVSFRLVAVAKQRVAVVWDDGKLSGSTLALSYLRALLRAVGGQPYALSPTGPWYDGDPVVDPLAFLVFCQNTLPGVRVTGDVPMLSPVPGHLIA